MYANDLNLVVNTVLVKDGGFTIMRDKVKSIPINDFKYSFVRLQAKFPTQDFRFSSGMIVIL